MEGERKRQVAEDETTEGEEGEEGESTSWMSKWKRRLALLKRESVDATTTLSRRRGALRLRPFIIHPENPWFVAWTYFILLWAVYSSFFTPLEFGFFRGLPENLFFLDIAGQIAFLFDILIHFFLAYRHPHSYRIIDDPTLVARRYLKSRFCVDLLGCLPWDAIFKACGRKEAVRYLLWIRLSRALRVTEFFEKLEKDIRLNYLFTRIVKLLVVELYCTHTAACIFYYLATTMPPSEEGYTWIGSLQMGDYRYINFRDIDLWKRYVTSLYFAIVTMATVGYGEIHPVNIKEMIFVMIYVSFDMILGAYLLGNMTALIVKGSKTERFRDKMAEIIKYMNRNNLERKLSCQIKSHLCLQYDCSYSEAAVLRDIPASIRTKISRKLYEPFIREVSLFRGCSSRFIKQIAIRVHEEFFLPGEVLIEQGSIADNLYIICHGELEEMGKRKGNEPEDCPIHLQAYSSVGEESFFCNIAQPYTVKVCELSRVLRLDKQSFMEILEIYFYDAQITLNNLLEGKDSNFRNKLLESEVTLFIGKHESELASRLNCAAHDGDAYRLKCLIGAGIDPNKTDYDGRSPLHVAASRGFEDITHFLIQQGVNVNITDKDGNSPLLEAIKNGHDGVVSLLVKAGSSLKINDAGGFLCTTVSRRDLNLLKKVLVNGLNPNAKNYDGRTPLHVAAAEGLCSATKLLLEAGSGVLARDRWGNTPIDEARIGGEKELIDLLEAAKVSQMSKLSSDIHGVKGKGERKRCTVFGYAPWEDGAERKAGVVMWVPETMEELIKTAAMQLDMKMANCILAEDGGRVLEVNMIDHQQKLYLVHFA